MSGKPGKQLGFGQRGAKALLNACASLLVLTLLLTIACFETGFADEPIPPPEPSAIGLGTPTAVTAPGVTPSSETAVSELREAAERLGRERARLRADFGAEQRDGLHYSSSRARHSADVDDVRRLSQRLREEEQRRSERLKEKLERIRHLVRSGVPCPTPLPTPEIADAPIPDELQQASEPAPNLAEDTEAEEPPLIPADRLVEVTPRQAPVDSVTSLTAKTSDPDLASLMSQNEDAEAMRRAAFALVEEPVDRVRMADNLYGAGEIKLALEVYQNVDQARLSESSRLWVAYQIANCFHRLGQQMDAERGYRVVTGMSKEGWISQNARWWLEVNDKAKALESQAKQLDDIYQQLQEVSNGNAGTP
jgi:hypothetical protein